MFQAYVMLQLFCIYNLCYMYYYYYYYYYYVFGTSVVQIIGIL